MMSFGQRGADVNWQRDKTFLDANLYMLENEIAVDVTFIVGGSSQFPHTASDLLHGVSNVWTRPVPTSCNEGVVHLGVEMTIHAHRFMLIARSCVFEAMFCGGMIENGLKRDQPIRVIDVDAEIFKEVLRYIYGECAEVTDDNVLRLWYAARKYLLEHLERICIEYLRDSLTADNVCNVLNHSLILDCDILKQQCLCLIAMDTNTIVRSNGFLLVSIAGLEDILSLNAVAATELEMYEACLRWVDGQPDQEDIQEDENNSDVDGSIIENELNAGELEHDACNEQDGVNKTCVVSANSASFESIGERVSNTERRCKGLCHITDSQITQRCILKTSNKRKITNLYSPSAGTSGAMETFDCASKYSRLNANLPCQYRPEIRLNRASIVTSNIINNRIFRGGVASTDSVATATNVEPSLVASVVIPSNNQTITINAAPENVSTSHHGEIRDAGSVSFLELSGDPRIIKTESAETENVSTLALGRHSKGAKVRACLRNVFYRIRFPTMKPEIFAGHFGQSDVLSGDEKCAVYYHLITHANSSTGSSCLQQPEITVSDSHVSSSSTIAPLLFDSCPRRLLVPHTVERFEKLSIDLSDEGAHGGRYVGLHAIRFKVDRDVLISGIGLYSGITKDCAPFDVRIRVLKAQRCLVLRSTKVDAAQSIGGVVHVSLDRNLYARSDIDYTIIVDITKSHGCRFFGQQGRAICPAAEAATLHTGGVDMDNGGATFKFSNASLKLSSPTNVGEGQIAQLYYISA